MKVLKLELSQYLDIPLEIQSIIKLSSRKVIFGETDSIPSTYQVLQPGDDCSSINESSRYLYIQENSCNQNNITTFVLTNMDNLEEVRIGSYSFRNVEQVIIKNLASLRTVIFGSFSFNNQPELYIPYLRPGTGIEIMNCPLLNRIEFESYSFGDFNSLVIKGRS